MRLGYLLWNRTKAVIATIIWCMTLSTAHGLALETVVFHCQTSCKIYVDGKLLSSMPSGGIKQTELEGGERRVIVITRPGKRDWNHIVKPSSPLSIDPNEKSPTVISEDVPQDGSAKVSQSTGATNADGPYKTPATSGDSDKAAIPQLPSWAFGSWTFKVEDKQFTLTDQSISCPATVSQEVGIHIPRSGVTSRWLTFNQEVDTGTLGRDAPDACFEYYMQHDQNWNFQVPISLTVENQDTLSFSADMQKCYLTYNKSKPCRVPGGGGQITGTLRLGAGAQVEVELIGPLPGSFTLSK